VLLQTILVGGAFEAGIAIGSLINAALDNNDCDCN
jgi:hypothetical protein